MHPHVSPPVRALGSRSKADRRSRGQVLIIYVAAIFVFIGMLAIVIDVSWYWINSNRIQKAADAAALAGVVWLPGDQSKAVQTAIYEAAKNGYTVASSGVPLNGVTITAAKAAGNDRLLNVTISAPVSTFFMRVFGLNTIPASRSARAEYVLPVAMGSPENYYGVFGDVRGATMTSTSTNTTTGARTAAGPQVATQTFTGTNWSASSGTLITAVNSNNNIYARTTSANALQQWGNFGLATAAGGSPIPNPITSGNPTTAINIVGLVVNLDDAFLSATCNNSMIGAELTWEGSKATPTWSTQVKAGNLGTSTTSGDYALGSQTNTTAWGAHTWVRSDFTDANFRIQLQALKGCGTSGIQFNVDQVQVTVYYTVSTTTTTTTTTPPANYPLHGPGSACVNGATQCYQSDAAGGGQALNPRGFWATMNTEGAENLNGDAFQPYYDNGSTVAPACPTATLRSCYDPDDYYNYAVEMPPNSTGGYVYIFDPVFCETDVASGTGDRHFNGDGHAVSSFYELYDTGTSLFSRADDTLIVSSGSTFTGMDYSDPSMGGGTGGSDCRQKATSYGDARDYHDSWYLLNPSNPLTGGPTGTVYRVHTTGTDPANLAQQRSADGEQSFAIYATDPGSGRVPQGVRPRCDADVHATDRRLDAARLGVHVLPRPDRPDPCRQDAGAPPLGSGRHPVAHRGPRRPDPVVHDGCLERHAVLLFSEGRDVRFGTADVVQHQQQSEHDGHPNL